MKRTDFLKRKIETHLRKEQLLRSEEYMKLERPYLAKARKNFTIANILIKISDEDKLKRILKLAEDFDLSKFHHINLTGFFPFCFLFRSFNNIVYANNYNN